MLQNKNPWEMTPDELAQAAGGARPATPGIIRGAPKAPDPIEQGRYDLAVGEAARAQQRFEIQQGQDARRDTREEAKDIRDRSKTGFDQTLDLRSKYEALPAVKSYNSALTTYASGLQSAPNAAGDLQLISAYAKTMDPMTGVQAGESAAVAGGQSFIDQTTANLKNQLSGDGSFTPEFRDKLRREMATRVGELNRAFIGERVRYKTDAEAFGIDPMRVVGEHPGERFQRVESQFLGRPVREADYYGNPLPVGVPGATPRPDGKVVFNDQMPQDQVAAPDGFKATPEQEAALKAFYANNKGFTGEQLKAFGQSIGLPAAMNADAIAEYYAKGGSEFGGIVADPDTDKRYRESLRANSAKTDKRNDYQVLAGQGITQGLSDEALGLGNAVSQFFSGKDPLAGYREARDQERVRATDARDRAGALGTVTEIGSSMFLPVGTLAGGVKSATKLGAIGGALAGFGYGEGGQSVPNALTGAVVGGAIGKGLEKGGNAVASFLTRRGTPTAPDGFRNITHQTPAIQVGRAGADDLVTEQGFTYRSISRAELADAQGKGGFLPNPSGRSSGGQRNAKHWVTGGDSGQFYSSRALGDAAVVVRVPNDAVQPGQVVSMRQAEVLDPSLGFRPIPVQPGKFDRGVEIARAAQVADIARTEGVPVSRGLLDPAARNSVSALETTPGGGLAIQSGLGKTADAIESRVGKLGNGGTVRDETVAGETIQEAGRRLITKSRAVVGRLYDRAERLGGEVEVLPVKAAQAIRTNINELTQSGEDINAGLINYLQDLKNAIGKDGGMTITSLRNLRTQIRGQISERNLTFSDAERRAMQVLDAASDDIAAKLATTNPAAAAAYARADRAFRAKQIYIKDVVQKFTGPRDNPLSAEKAYRKMESFAAAGGDSRRHAEMMKSLSPDEARDIAATYAADLGRSTDGTFSPGLLVTHAENMSDRAKLTMFGPSGKQSLDNLAAISREFKAVKMNTSRTAVGNNYRSWLAKVVGLAGGAVGAAGGYAAGGSGGAVVGSALVGSAAAKVTRAAENFADGHTAKVLMDPDVSKWLRSAPRTTDPKAIDAHFKKLGSIATRNPALAGEVNKLSEWLVRAANDNTLARSSASGNDPSRQDNK